MPDSSTGGYLEPTSGAAVADDALDDFFQAWIVGITGLDGSLVRPRFQNPPPNLPDFGTTWIAVGVMPTIDADSVPWVGHTGAVGETPGFDTEVTNESLEVLVSVYGPQAQQYARMLRDGCKIAQNREPLFLASMGLASVSGLTRMPELVKEQWLNRYDLTITVRRAVSATFAVLDLAELEATEVLARADGTALTVTLESTL